MTDDPEAIVRRAYALLGQSDDELRRALAGLLAADAEWVNPPEALERGTRVGLDGWVTAVANLRAGVGVAATYEITELEARGDRVRVRGFLRPRGTSSGAEVEGQVTHSIWTVHDGKIRRYEWYFDAAQADAAFNAAP